MDIQIAKIENIGFYFIRQFENEKGKVKYQFLSQTKEGMQKMGNSKSTNLKSLYKIIAANFDRFSKKVKYKIVTAKDFL